MTESIVFLGNLLKFMVTRDRTLILAGSFDQDAPKEPVIFRRRPIVHALMILAHVIEEQGGPGSVEGEEAPPRAG